ncbi:MAG: T9SS type A sorting domain-containing protein [Bacteroidota bacterium]|nr:T9SS type A sorting domain-containing protein [Bacteroidota bacterium]
MKKTIFLSIFLLSTFLLFSQNFRYVNTIFDNVKETKNIEYATAPILDNIVAGFDAYNIHGGENTTKIKKLHLDIYEPDGDTVEKRPAIIFAHSGAFLFGSKSNEDIVAFCDSFAKKGYVTISMDYRLGIGAEVNYVMGFPVKVSIKEENAVRAVYRSIQDGKAAVSFLRKNASTYKIDTSKIYFAGSSSGAFICIQNIYMDETNEIPLAASPGVNTYVDLGGLNENGAQAYGAKANGIVEFWGALKNISFIKSTDNIPALLIHGTIDDTVSFKAAKPLGNSIPPNSILTMDFPIAYGSYCIDSTMTSLGIEHETYFVKNQGHEFHGAPNGKFLGGEPTAFWDTIIIKTRDFLYNLDKPIADFSFSTNEKELTLANKSTDAVVWLWDFGDATTSTDENPKHNYIVDNTYKVSLYVMNEINSWDTISKTVLIKSSSIEKNNSFNKISISPNPNSGIFNIYFQGEFNVNIFDINGKLMCKIKNANEFAKIDMANSPKGIYLINIINSKGEYFRKIVIE